MEDSGEETHALRPDAANCQENRIRLLNDAFRTHGRGNGRLVLTQGIRALGDEAVLAVLTAMRSFNEFTHENDPYGEHDLGSGLIDQSQEMTVAAMAMAEKKVWAHRS